MFIDIVLPSERNISIKIIRTFFKSNDRVREINSEIWDYTNSNRSSLPREKM